MRGVRSPGGRWGIVAALAVTEPVSWGILFYAVVVLQGPMAGELGWSRPQVTGAFSLALLVSGLSALPIGRWLDRHGPRALMTTGSVLGVVSVAAWSRVSSLGLFYLVAVGLGLAMAATFYEPAFVTIARLFPDARSRPLTVVTVGGALASPIFLPLTNALVERTDWRETLLILAALLAVVTIPLHALVVHDRPSPAASTTAKPNPLPGGEAGTRNPPPGGEGEVRAPSSVSDALSLSEALRAPSFWWINLSFVLSVSAVTTTTVHLIPYLIERGIAPAVAATATGFSTGLALVGRLVFTPLGDRIRRQAVVALIYGMQAAGIASLLLFGTTGIWLFVGLAGMIGAITPLRAALLADLYGTASYGAISGASALLLSLARAATPLGSSLLARALGGYDALFWGLVAGCLAAALAVLAARPTHP